MLKRTLAAALIAWTACDGATGPEGAEPIDRLPRALSAAELAVIDASNAFAFDLLREVHAREDESPNVFLSPLSASMALGMTMNGAAGETFDSMRATLRFGGLGQQEINRSYRDLTDLLLALDPNVELGIANATFAREGHPFEPAFFEVVREWFDAEARELDFADPAAVDEINGWAADHTNDRIDRVIDRIEPGQILFLLNAVYFDAAWTERFDPEDTRAVPFTLADGSQVEVERMHGEHEAALASVDGGITIGELPYGGGAFVLTVVVPPPEMGLAELVAGLDAEIWTRWTSALGEYDTIPVGLPKLELEYEEELNDALIALGMGPAFDGRADFSRMTPSDAVIDFVKQNTFLKMDEEGTEAAAVTTVGIIETALPAQLIIDRPYLIAIRERLSGAILFLGAIGDPNDG